MTIGVQQLRTWWGRLAGIVSAALLLVVACAPVAFADTGAAAGPLGWIDLQDTRGISVWQHELSLDRGTGFPFNPEKFFWSTVTDFSWNYYRGYCALVLWFLDWVLRLEWVGLLASPLLEIGDALQLVVDRLGLVPTFLTITALVAGIAIFRGRKATGVWDILIACVISALAVGVFAQPVRMVAGENGYIVGANRLGQEVAAGLATGESKDRTPDELRRAQTGQMVDVFIRQPLQMINYGSVIDGGSCEATYNDVLKSGPYGGASTIRDKVAECNKTLGDYAANPSVTMAGSAMIFQPSGFIILIFSVLLAGSVVAAGGWAMYRSVHAIWSFVSSLLPGGNRFSILEVIADIFVSLVIIVYTSVFLSVFLLVIQALFAGSTNPARTFVIVDVVLIVGIIVFMRQRSRIRGMTQRIAQTLAWRPGAPSQLPSRTPGPNPFGAAVRTLANVGQLGAQMAANRRPVPSGGPTYVDARQQAIIFGPGMGGGMPPAGGGYAYQTHPQGPGPVVVPGQVVEPSAGHPQLPAGSSGNAPLPGGGGAGPELPGGPTRGELPPGPGTPPSGNGGGSSPSAPPTPSPRLSRAQRAKQVGGALVRAGTNAALGYLTGGTSTVARVAGKAGGALRAARRTALAARMASGTGKPSAPTRKQPRPPQQAPAGSVVTGPVLDPQQQPPRRPNQATQRPSGRPTTDAADQLRQRLADRSRRRPPPAT